MSKPLRILCLGNSLVYGYSDMGASEHPFAGNLAKFLRMTLVPIARATDIDIVVDGKPGDLVTRGQFLERMQKQVVGKPEPFDWVIVLGGTNDLAYSIPADSIFDKLQEIWQLPLSRGSEVLALTVPETAIDDKYPDLVERRNALNDKIKSYEADGFHFYDLHAALPYDTTHAKYWDDSIHFTPDGYDFIGDKLGVALVGLIMAQPTRI